MQHHSTAQAAPVPRAPHLTSLVLVASAALLFIPSSSHAIAAIPVTSLDYKYSVDGTLKETGSMPESSSPYWWLNSGGYLILDNGIGETYQGSAPTNDGMGKLYKSSNPYDTDGGAHPQNLFRLVSRSSWNNVAIESSYKINRDNFSDSSNRNQSNGLLLMSRYQDDGQTLYYAGIRVDGHAVIKKKKNGAYTTLAEKQIFPGSYAIASKVNLIPHNTWLTLKSETITNGDGSVTVRLSMKKAGETAFTKLLEAKDASSPITVGGYVGIRTDFMDVEFDNFKAIKI